MSSSTTNQISGDPTRPLWSAASAFGAAALIAGLLSLSRRRVRRFPAALGIGAGLASILVSNFAIDGAGPSEAARQAVRVEATPANNLPGISGLRLPLADVIPVADEPVSDDELDARFDAFSHAPIEAAGFNALLLPFRYVDADKIGDAAEANAFSFLMSFALDWAPGSYCSRHAYFAFKRSRDTLVGFQQAYRHAALQGLIDGWGATHAVGGEIVKHADGYSGTLEIFARNGRTTYRKAFDEPRPYFTLLGDEAADALQFFGYKASPTLVQHLSQPRCKHVASIALLGKAAFAPERTRAEFSLYDAILKDDPDFGEVRFWRANQGNWSNRDDRSKAVEVGRAMESYLQPGAFAEFDADRCNDATLRARVPIWEDAFNVLVGEDHPCYLGRLIDEAAARGPIDGPLLERGLRLAVRFPNAYDLERSLNFALLKGEGPMDADLAAALGRCAEDSLFQTGTGDKSAATVDVADAAHELAEDAVAIGVLKDAYVATDDVAAGLLVQAQFNGGRFAEAFASFQANRAAFRRGSPRETKAAGTAAVAAIFAGRPEVAREIHSQFVAAFAGCGMDFVLNAYDDLAAGKATDVGLKVAPAGRIDWCIWQWTLLLAQVDLLKHQERFRGTFESMLFQLPNERLGWFLEEQYQRGSHHRLPGFHAWLKWLHAGDPWVKTAGFPAIEDDDSAFDVTRVVSAYDDLPAVRWPRRDQIQPTRPYSDRVAPWEVVEAVHRMLARGELAQARKLSLKFYAFATTLDLRDNRVVANHLIHLIETAQRNQTKF